MSAVIVFENDDSLSRVLKRVAVGFVAVDIPTEAKSTLFGIKGSFKLAYKSLVGIKNFSSSSDKCEQFINSMKELKAISKRSATACRAFSNQFQFDFAMMSAYERRIYMAKLAMYTASFGAGAYLGDSLPDKDIKILGIGSHRNFAFHSIISAFVGRLMLRFLERITNSISEEGFLDEGDAATIRYCLSAARGGVAAGVATHLAIDGTIQGSKAVLFGNVGTLVGGTLIDDRAWLLVNSFASLIMGFGKKEELAN